MSVDAGFDSGDSGSDYNFDVDIDATDDAPAVDTSSGDSGSGQQASNVRRNPAWNTLMDKLPEQFQTLAEPVLREWDSGVQKRFQQQAQQLAQLKQYEQFAQQQLDPQQLLASHQLVEQLNGDPVAFLERLKGALIERGMYEEAQEVQDQQDEYEDEDGVEFRDPRVDALEQQQQAFLQQIAEAQAEAAQEEATARAISGITEEMDFIKSKVGNLPDWAEAEIYDRAALMTQREGRPVSLTEAYKEFVSLRNNLIGGGRPGGNAPRVVPGGGGYPAPQIDKSKLNDFDGRTSAITEIMNRQQG